MNRRSYTCSWWEYAGHYGPFVNGISSPVMRELSTQRELLSSDLPVGALYAVWDEPPDYYRKGYDGLIVVCRAPDGGDWYIDGQAANCTMPQDKVHNCWVRHGTVGEKITVDKKGNTCRAGGGSLWVGQKTAGEWHGYLVNGELRSL